MIIKWTKGTITVDVDGEEVEVIQYEGKFSSASFYIMEVGDNFYPEYCLHGVSLSRNPLNTLEEAQQICENFLVTMGLSKQLRKVKVA